MAEGALTPDDATIIVKNVGKVAFFTPSFPSPPPPRPWSNVDQNVNVCALNCSVISQHCIEGTGDIWKKRKLSNGLLLSYTTFPTSFVCDCRKITIYIYLVIHYLI